MPYELPIRGDQNTDIRSRTDEFDRQTATALLTGLKTEVAGGKKGC